ncbi:hypothetical protein JB92DRAFT_3112411 [Gautieria morchelliformis]|nr:hypothetical protein JB92DRAFT_3112411 [Gautieria morchelliformis]
MKSDEVIESMKDYPFFVNQDNLLQSLQWEAIGGSSVVTQRSSGIEADFVFPVQITSNRLFVGHLGAYSGNVGTLEKAKYRMTCTAPSDPTLRNIYNQAMDLFRVLQGQIAKTQDRRYLWRPRPQTLRLSPAWQYSKKGYKMKH